MSELPFEIPTNQTELAQLFTETRKLLSSQWDGVSEEDMVQRPGPHPEWSVKDMIAHICWWETFALVRIPIVAAGLPVALIEDFDALNAQVDEWVRTLPLETVLDQFKANETLILSMIEHYSFEQWADESRPNYSAGSLMRLLGGNTFGHYYDHIPDLQAYRQRL